ncbi:MAG: prolyl oligopeptidase family serine peptidase [Brumimicrobium sp.]
MKNLINFILIMAVTGFGYAQENIDFQLPTEEILQLADYQRPPSTFMDSKKETMIFVYRPTYKALEEISQDEMKLGGIRINPKTNISSTVSYAENLKIRRKNDRTEQQVKNLPKNPKLAYFSISPDEKYLAFTHTTNNGVELWTVDMETVVAKKITDDNLNANLGRPFSWHRDSKGFLVNVLPDERPSLLNSDNDLPSGPTVATSTGEVSQNRTYQDLLKNPLDEQNFETLTTSFLVNYDLNGTSSQFIEKSGIFASKSFSPDGNYIMITEVLRPFSYMVPYNRFPMKTTVYNMDGKVVKVVNEVPLNEIQPKGFSSTRKGKRSMNWRPDLSATLYFVKALDEGDQSIEVEFRDEVFTWEAPFDTEPKSLLKLNNRYAGFNWGDKNNAFVYEFWYDTRNIKSHWVNPSTSEMKLWNDRNFQDIYNNPGDFYTTNNEFNLSTLFIQDNKAYLIGDGHTKKGQFPFIDELNLGNLKSKRLFTVQTKDRKEDIVDILNIKKNEILIMDQSPSDYPNFYKKNFKSGKMTPLTNNKNPFESLKDVYKEVITYQREDGVELTGTLYLPANYDRKSKKEKLPLLIWAYPREYKDKSTAGQSSQNPNSFTYPYYGSFVYWVTKGYAVLDDAAFPIVGEGENEPNDSFIEQLVANGKAAIDAVDNLGYIDRSKVGVGGHSYGAFMTANLLTHSDLFACGIARSGAYNRTLTPFGFQSEQRNYWDNPDIYNTMSPFMNADKMKTPMLLVHGEEDNNSGTYTEQTKRYFAALKNLGAPVRMVLLPKESHGYVAKENILHLLYEQDVFLEKYLK